MVLIPSKGCPIKFPLCVDSWYRPPIIILLVLVVMLFIGGASGDIHIVISPTHSPFDFAIRLCDSPGVIYSIQALLAVAVSTATHSSAGLASFEAEATFGSSAFFSSPQAINKTAVQKAIVIRFI